MKCFKENYVIAFFGVALLALSFGCASDSTNPSDKKASANPASAGVIKAQPIPLPDGVTLKKDKDIQEVWLASGFDFKGYDSVYISVTVFKAIERPNESEMRAAVVRFVRDEEVGSIGKSGLFKIVTSNTNDIPIGSKTLKLANTIIEYEKGGGAARYWAGTFGAGQPVAKVRGLMYDGDKLVFVYEARRSGDSGVSRMFGGFMSDEDIQRNDISDMAVDLAGFMRRTAGVAAQK